MPDSHTHPATLSLLVVLLLSPAQSLAGNLDSFFFGPEAMLTGGAVLATTTGGEAIWYNPAGLAATDRNSFDLTVTAYNLRLRRINDGLEAVFPESHEREDLDGTEVIIAAAALTTTLRLSERALLGFGVFLTDKDRVRIDSQLDEVTSTGAEIGFTGQLDADGEFYRVGPAVGLRLTDDLRLGIGLFGIYGTLAERVRLGIRSVDATVEPATRIVELAEVDTNRTRVGLEPVVGVQWEPFERLSLGLVVRGPGLLLAEKASTRLFDVTGVITPGLDPFAELLSDRADSNLDLTFDVLSAPRVLAGLAWRFDRGRINLEGDFRPGLTDDSLDLDDDPVWNLRAGGLYDFSDSLTLGAGLFTDRAPSQSQAALNGPVDFYGLALGARFSSPVALDEAERAPSIVFTTTIGVRYALGLGEVLSFRADVSELFEGQGVLGESNPVDVTVHEFALTIGTGVTY